jgi:hypothetical protein
MGAGLLAVKGGFILFIKSYQFPLHVKEENEKKTLSQKWHRTKQAHP